MHPNEDTFDKWWCSISDDQLDNMTPTEKAWAAYKEGYTQARADYVKGVTLDAIKQCDAPIAHKDGKGKDAGH